MVRKILHPQNNPLLHCSIPTISLTNNNIMMMMITRRHQIHKSTNHNHPIHIINPRHHQNQNIKQITSCSLLGDQQSSADSYSTITRLKSDINKILQGMNRGIFGIPSEKKSEIEEMVKVLESLNPNPYSTIDLDKLGGCWKLIYSTITILGSKRTKLGLRDFISLGDFLQLIDVAKGKAVNVIKFNVRGLNLFSGKLIIEASFKISSKSRVDIRYNNSTIIPDQLMNMFRKNYDVLLGIFNPDGWLEITYVDETLRIGRDDKGNIFILERLKESDL